MLAVRCYDNGCHVIIPVLFPHIPIEPRPLCLGGSMGARKGKSLEVNIECQVVIILDKFDKM